MAQRTVVQLFDDLDGNPIEEGKGETVRFALDRQDYEIDLNEKNAAAMRDALAKYVGVARKARAGAGTGRGRRAESGQSGSGEREYDPKEVRAWAAEHDIEVPTRGRIPSTVVVQFKEATGRG
jgi:hypothetical protein